MSKISIIHFKKYKVLFFILILVILLFCGWKYRPIISTPIGEFTPPISNQTDDEFLKILICQ